MQTQQSAASSCGLRLVRAIPSSIVKRRERANKRHPECILPRHKIASQHAPGALRIANSPSAGELIHGNSKLDSFIHNGSRKRLGNQHSAGPSEVALSSSIKDVGPTLKKHQALVTVAYNIESTFEAYEEFPWRARFFRNGAKRLGTVSRARHEFRTRKRRVADSARRFHACDFKYRFGIKQLAKERKRIRNGVQLWASSASYRNNDFVHLL